MVSAMEYRWCWCEPHETLGGEDDGEDDLDLFQEVICCVGVAIGKGGKHCIGEFIMLFLLL